MMTNGRIDILIIMGRYLPGYKDGGPVRSIKNLVDFLGKEYNFKILTCDRDHGDKRPYPNIKINDWNHVGNAEVYYVPPKGFSQKQIVKLAKHVDLVYVCGCFSDYAINTLIANRLGKIKIPVVVAAMGLFSPMEFKLKYKKKKFFTTVFNIFGMFKNIYWSATSEMEISEICQQVNVDREHFYIAEDLPRKVDETPILKNKKINFLDVVWISRITPKKNLMMAIKILKKVNVNINFTIYGPIHEQKYWEKCENELKEMPSNIKWKYKGNVNSENVVDTLKQQQVFLFPTLGENYGHVIQEALSAGCPCILSDQTPWRDLADYEAGYVFPLNEEQLFVKAIERYAKMNQEEFQKISQSVLMYAIKNSNEKVLNTGYREVFDLAVNRRKLSNNV